MEAGSLVTMTFGKVRLPFYVSRVSARNKVATAFPFKIENIQSCEVKEGKPFFSVEFAAKEALEKDALDFGNPVTLRFRRDGKWYFFGKPVEVGRALYLNSFE